MAKESKKSIEQQKENTKHQDNSIPLYTATLDKQHPFIGLVPYNEKDKGFFFGRNNEIEKIKTIVTADVVKPLLIYGKRGIGKTSLIRAGVMQAVKSPERLPIYIRVNYENDELSPIEQIKQIIAAQSQKKLDLKEGGALAQFLKKSCQSEKKHIILFIDQFEELFTIGEHQAKHIEDTLKQFEDVVSESVKNSDEKYTFRIVFSVREDYLTRFKSLKIAVDHEVTRFHLLYLNGVEALKAISQPNPELINHKVAESIINILPEQANPNLKHIGWKEKQIDPSMMNIVCYQLNIKRLKEKAKTISFELFTGLQIQDIFWDYYSTQTSDFSPVVLRQLEKSFVTDEGYRKMVLMDDFLKLEKVTKEDIEKLLKQQIIHTEVRPNNTIYLELIHDNLAPIVKLENDKHEAIEQQKEEQNRLKEQLRQQKKKVRRAIGVGVGFFLVILLLSGMLWYANVKKNEANRQRIKAGLMEKLASEKQIKVTEQKKIIDKLISKLGIIYGNVIDNHGSPIDSVKISIEGIERYTDSTGYFIVEIPEEKLETKYSILAQKNEYKLWSDTIIPGAFNSLAIRLKEIPKVVLSAQLNKADKLIKESKFSKAFELTNEAAAIGDKQAYNKLGELYASGKGTNKDFDKALHWFKKGAASGDKEAEYNLGNMYFSGSGVIQDVNAAERWYRTAAKKGSAEAQNKLGYIYYKGEGHDPDFEEAFKWYKKSAEQGKPEAYNYLGLMYYMGRGVNIDYVKAVEYYRLAAEKELPNAMNNLGVCYHLGRGVPKDIVEAAYWYKKAADKGSEAAKIMLKKIGVTQ